MQRVLFPLAVVAAGILAAGAVDVDDTSPLITYLPQGRWTVHTNVEASFQLYNSSDTFTDIFGATASFTFTGQTIEYWGNRGPYHGPCKVEIDGAEVATVNSHATADAAPIKLYSANNLSDGEHTIVITIIGTAYPNVCEVDRFVYTNTPTSTTNGSGNGDGEGDGEGSGGGGNSSTLAIALGAGIGGGVLLLLILIFGIFFWRRRRRSRLPNGVDTAPVSQGKSAFRPANTGAGAAPVRRLTKPGYAPNGGGAALDESEFGTQYANARPGPANDYSDISAVSPPPTSTYTASQYPSSPAPSSPHPLLSSPPGSPAPQRNQHLPRPVAGTHTSYASAHSQHSVAGIGAGGAGLDPRISYASSHSYGQQQQHQHQVPSRTGTPAAPDRQTPVVLAPPQQFHDEHVPPLPAATPAPAQPQYRNEKATYQPARSEKATYRPEPSVIPSSSGAGGSSSNAGGVAFQDVTLANFAPPPSYDETYGSR